MELREDESQDNVNLSETSVERAVSEYLSYNELEPSVTLLTNDDTAENYITRLRLCDMKKIAKTFKLADYRNISKRNLTRSKMVKIITENWTSVRQYVIDYVKSTDLRQLEECRKILDIREEVKKIVLWNRRLKQGDEVDMHIAIQQPPTLTSKWRAWYKSYTLRGRIELRKGELITVKVFKTAELPPQIADYYSFTWQFKKGSKRNGYSLPGFNSVSVTSGIARIICPLETSDLLNGFYKW